MARLLPSTPDTSAAEEVGPRVIGVDEEDADDLLSALSSETARDILNALHEEPAAPSEIADEVDTSLQNTQYHLGNLEDAGLVEVIDTAYSEKGREMNVFAPADRPLVMVAGGGGETAGIRSMVTDLFGGLGLIGLLSLVIHALAGGGVPFLGAQSGAGAGGAGDGGGGPGIMAVGTPTPTPVAGGGSLLPIGWLVDFLTAPGTLFFLGGALVLLVGLGVRYRRRSVR